MKNYVQPGSNLTLPAPGAVSSGDGVLVGAIFGIASYDAAQNADVVIATQGVFTMPKVSTDAFAIGGAVYWDDAQALVTVTTAGNTKIGVAVTAAGNPSGEVAVRLNGAF